MRTADIRHSYRAGDEKVKAAVLSECRKRGINDTEINWEE